MGHGLDPVRPVNTRPGARDDTEPIGDGGGIALDHDRAFARVALGRRRIAVRLLAEKDTFIIELKDMIAKLEGQVPDYRRSKFGPKSEKLDPAQLELVLEDLDAFDGDLPPKAIMKRTPSDFGKNHDPRRARAKNLTHAALREPDSTIAPEIHICIALMNRFNALGTADIVRLA